MITVNIKMNGYDYTMKKGITILDASFETLKMQREFMQQPIPTLYYLKGVQDVDMSGVCIAEVDGEIINASVTKIKDGMEIQTHTPAIMEARKKHWQRFWKNITNPACTVSVPPAVNCRIY